MSLSLPLVRLYCNTQLSGKPEFVLNKIGICPKYSGICPKCKTGICPKPVFLLELGLK